MTNDYLETQVNAATPQQLRLMLIEGAARFAKQTVDHWRADNQTAALESLSRCRAIVAELMAGVKHDAASWQQIVEGIQRQSPATVAEKEEQLRSLKEVTAKTTSVYLFVYQELTELQFDPDEYRMMDVIAVLTVEEETARIVCDRMPDAPRMTATDTVQELKAADAPALAAGDTATYASPQGAGDATPSSGVSFEA